jgi:predicted MPP superfamily phosphohydrolase
MANLWRSLAGMLGVMQVLVIHWLAVVVLGREGLGLGPGLGLGVVLVVLNLATVPVLRRARMRGGGGRRGSRLYMAVGISTLLVGFAVAASWLGIFPLTSLLAWLGLGSAPAFTLFRVLSLLLVGAVAFAVLWAFTGGQKKVDRTLVQIPIEALPDEHSGLRLGHLTDLHIGNGLEGEALDAMVRDANDLDVDALVLTGDLFDFDPAYVEDGARRLGGLRAPLGVFAVLGNHDTYTGTDRVVEALREHAPGIRLLRNEYVALPVSGPPLYLAGVEDPGRGWNNRDLHLEALEELASRIPQDGPVLLLVHRPQAFPQAARLGFPLVLAGHTHGGQLALPIWNGSINLSRIMTRFTRGLYHMNGCTLYVNRGIGVAGPAVRFSCAREIATLELA